MNPWLMTLRRLRDILIWPYDYAMRDRHWHDSEIMPLRWSKRMAVEDHRKRELEQYGKWRREG